MIEIQGSPKRHGYHGILSCEMRGVFIIESWPLWLLMFMSYFATMIDMPLGDMSILSVIGVP
jgi:hypothetical protein